MSPCVFALDVVSTDKIEYTPIPFVFRSCVPSFTILNIWDRYGAPGVEFMGLHDENAAVTQVHFLPHQVKSEHSQQLFCYKNSSI